MTCLKLKIWQGAIGEKNDCAEQIYLASNLDSSPGRYIEKAQQHQLQASAIHGPEHSVV